MNAKTRFRIKAAIWTCATTWALGFVIETTTYINSGARVPAQIHADILFTLQAVFLVCVITLAAEHVLRVVMEAFADNRRRLASVLTRLEDLTENTQPVLQVVRQEVAVGRAPVATAPSNGHSGLDAKVLDAVSKLRIRHGNAEDE